MTLIELFLIPTVLAGVSFLVLLPLFGPKRAWDLAGTSALVTTALWFSVLYLRRTIVDKPPRCVCGADKLLATRVFDHGHALACTSCSRLYWLTVFRADGWKRCVQVTGDLQVQAWKRRRRWGGWMVDEELVPDVRDDAQLAAKQVWSSSRR